MGFSVSSLPSLAGSSSVAAPPPALQLAWTVSFDLGGEFSSVGVVIGGCHGR